MFRTGLLKNVQDEFSSLLRSQKKNSQHRGDTFLLLTMYFSLGGVDSTPPPVRNRVKLNNVKKLSKDRTKNLEQQ